MIGINLKKTRYNFGIKRLKWNNEIFDILRVDHLGLLIHIGQFLMEVLQQEKENG